MPLGAEFLIDAGAEPERGARRRELRLAAEASGSGKTAQVVIHNLSTTGLLIETSAELGESETLEVSLPEVGTIAASVIWKSDALYGCQFARPISEGAVAAALLRAPPSAGAPSATEATAVTLPPVTAAAEPVASTHDAWREPRSIDRGGLSLRLRFGIIVGISLALWTIIAGAAALAV